MLSEFRYCALKVPFSLLFRPWTTLLLSAGRVTVSRSSVLEESCRNRLSCSLDDDLGKSLSLDILFTALLKCDFRCSTFGESHFKFLL